MDDSTDFLIRCRLSDNIRTAIEFSARDARSLADGAERAFSRYVRQHGTPRHGLALQVRPVGDAQIRGGWWAPIRKLLAWDVRVSREILDSRSPDGWTDIWLGVAAARAADRRFRLLVESVADDAITPPITPTITPELQ